MNDFTWRGYLKTFFSVFLMWQMWVLCILLIVFFPAGIAWALYMWFSTPKPTQAQKDELNTFLDDTAETIADRVVDNQAKK